MIQGGIDVRQANHITFNTLQTLGFIIYFHFDIKIISQKLVL